MLLMNTRRRYPMPASLRVLMPVALAVAGLPAAARAQNLDSTLADLIDDQVSEQVESELVESLQQTIEAQVEAGTAEAVEQQIESGVADDIEQQIESGVADGIEQQIESGVADGIEQQIESGVADGIEQQIDAGLVEEVAQRVDSGVTGVVQRELDEVLEESTGASLPHELGNAAPEAVGSILDPLPSVPGGTEQGQSAAGQAQSSDVGRSATPAAFIAGIDEAGRTVEREVWMILVPPEHSDRIDGWGFDIQEQQTLLALDRVLLRVTAPEDRAIAEAALELALDAPGTLVDFNHAYGGEAGEDDDAAPSAPPPAHGGGQVDIGIIDTAVAAAHEALARAEILQRDFVRYEGRRPLGHGTAVASILVGETGKGKVRGRISGAQLYAASVFFEDAAGGALATTESLVEALEWLSGERVPVVNMSLSGPPNKVLEAALQVAAERNMIVVAAVGNDGPSGAALYPAAYDTVVGVTAVDAKNRIYRYANRGRQVMFAAPGVRVKVARSGGSYGSETGTSMAAPYAAAVIARSLAHAENRFPGDVLEALKATALDLGDRDFDEIYGFGLIVGH